MCVRVLNNQKLNNSKIFTKKFQFLTESQQNHNNHRLYFTSFDFTVRIWILFSLTTLLSNTSQANPNTAAKTRTINRNNTQNNIKKFIYSCSLFYSVRKLLYVFWLLTRNEMKKRVKNFSKICLNTFVMWNELTELFMKSVESERRADNRTITLETNFCCCCCCFSLFRSSKHIFLGCSAAINDSPAEDTAHNILLISCMVQTFVGPTVW